MSSESNDKNVLIRRSPHNKENPYVQISRRMLQDPELSPKSKGLLCYMLSMPSDWVTHARQIADAMGISKNQVYTIFNELMKLGYATKTLHRTDKGCFVRTVYEFYEEKIQINITVSRNPEMDNPEMDIGTLHNKQESKEEEKKEKKHTKKIGGVFFDRISREFKNIDEEYMAELRRTFPGIDIQTQLRLMRLWLIDPGNPWRLGNKQFIAKWLFNQIPGSVKISTFVMEPEPKLPTHGNMPPRNKPKDNNESGSNN